MGVERLIRDLKDADERLARRSSAGAGSRRGGDGTQRPVAAMRPWPIQAAAFSLVLFLVLGIGAGALWFFEYSPAAAGDGPAASSQPPGGPVTAPLTSTPTPTPTQRPTPTPRLREPVEVGLPQPPIVAVPPPPLSTPPVAIATASHSSGLSQLPRSHCCGQWSSQRSSGLSQSRTFAPTRLV